MRSRLFAAAKYVLYPFFYLTCLFACLYLTFPWDRLKDRIETEFARSQESKGSRAWRLQIDELDGYWISGVELTGAKIIMPPEEEEDDSAGVKPAAKKGALAKVAARKPAGDEADDAAPDADKDKDGDKEAEKLPPKDTVVLISEAHARVQLLPLLWGSVRVNFAAKVFNGEMRGVIPVGGGDLLLEMQDVDLEQMAPLKDVVGLPIKGIANGKLELTAANGKWSKASGTFGLTVTNMVVGDGKSKFRDLGVTFTPATVGTFEIQAKATEGSFKFEKFGSTGQEVELAGDGTLKLKEPWDASALDLWLRFGFSEAYKHKDDRTEVLFVDDGPFPALINQDRKLKRAKRSDGLWGFRIHGKLSRLRYDPTTADGPKGKSPAEATKKKAAKDDDEDDDSASVASKPTPGPFRSPGATKKPTGRDPMQPDPAGAQEDPVPEPSPVEPADVAPPEPDAPAPEGEPPPEAPPEEAPAPPQ